MEVERVVLFDRFNECIRLRLVCTVNRTDRFYVIVCTIPWRQVFIFYLVLLASGRIGLPHPLETSWCVRSNFGCAAVRQLRLLVI